VEILARAQIEATINLTRVHGKYFAAEAVRNFGRQSGLAGSSRAGEDNARPGEGGHGGEEVKSEK
jgi:hypothetical protein